MNDSCEGPMGDSASAVSGTSGALTFDVAVSGVPGVPGEPFSLLLHYDSSLDDPQTYGTFIPVEVRMERHLTLELDPGLDWAHVRGAEIQISDDAPPAPCGTNRIAWGVTQGSNGLGQETCHPFMFPGDIPIESLRPTILPPHDEVAGAGRCQFGDAHGWSAMRQFRLAFPVKVGVESVSMRRPLDECECLQAEDYTIPAGVHRIYPAITLDKGIPGSTEHYRCTQGFATFVRGTGATDLAFLGPNWSHNFADRLSVHASGGENFVVLESYTGKWVMFSKPSDQIPAEGRELQQVPEGTAVKELTISETAYCWDCKAWRLIQTPSGYMQVNRDGSRRVFTTDGRLARIEDHAGKNATTITWAGLPGTEVIDYITDAGGNVYDFHYQDVPLRLDRVILPGGRTWALHYDLAGRLDRIDDPESFANGPAGAMRFGYGTVGVPTVANNIVTKTLPDDEIVTYEYYCDPLVDLGCADCGLCGPLAFARNTRPGALKSARIGPDPARTFRYAYSAQAEGRNWMLVESPGAATTPYTYFEYAPCGKGSREIVVPASEIGAAMSWQGLSRNLAPSAVITATRSDHLGRVRSVQRGRWAGGTSDPWTDNENLVGPKTCLDYVGDPVGEASAKVLRQRGPICHEDDPPGTYFECDDLPPSSDACDPVDELVWEEVVPLNALFRRERLKAVVPASELDPGDPGLPQPWGFMYWPETAMVGSGELRAVCDPTEWITVPGLSDPFVVENCDGETTFEYELDAGGAVLRPKRTIDGEGNATEFTYQPFTSLLATVTDPLGLETSLAYDTGTNLLASVTQPGGRKTSWARNLRGQPTFVALPLDGLNDFSTQYEYSAGGRLGRILDPHRGTAWRLQYYDPSESSAGLPKSIEREPGGTGGSAVALEYWFWTPSGQLSTTMLAGDIGRMVVLGRDEFGSLETRNWSGLPALDECWFTDPLVGRPASVAFQTPWNNPAMDCSDFLSREVTESFQYDDAGRLRVESFVSTLPTEDTRYFQVTTFDLDGQVASRRASSLSQGPIGETTYTHDPAGRPLDVNVYRFAADDPWEPGFLEALSFRFPDGTPAYDRDGRPLRRFESERNRETTWTWRDDGKLQQQDVLDWNILDPLVGQDIFTYEGFTGRLSRVEHRVPRPDIPALGYKEVFDFVHDLNDQLVHAHAHQDTLAGFPLLERYEHDYVYDRSWNLLEIHDLLASTTQTFPVDGHDRLQGPQYAYDAGFNLARKGLMTTDHDEFTFDVLNRLKQHRRVNGFGVTLATTDYAYDPFNRLVGIEDSSGRRWRAYAGWELAVDAETDEVAPDWRFFQGAGGGTVGHVRPAEDFEAYDRNLQGSRETIAQGEFGPIYEPYGKFSVAPGLDESRITFQGHEWRQESALFYMRNRWYDPGLGRFLSVDPVRSGAVNNFAFALGSPILRGDALGLLPHAHETYLQQVYVQARGDEDAKKQAVIRGARNLLRACATSSGTQWQLDQTESTPLLYKPAYLGTTRGMVSPEGILIFPEAFVSQVTWDGGPEQVGAGRQKYGTSEFGDDLFVNLPEGGLLTGLDEVVATVAHETAHAALPFLSDDDDPITDREFHRVIYALETQALQQLWNNPECTCVHP